MLPAGMTSKWLRFPSLYAFQCRYNRCVKISTFTFEFFFSSNFFALHSASDSGVPSHSGSPPHLTKMFSPSGDHNSPSASGELFWSLCFVLPSPFELQKPTL